MLYAWVLVAVVAGSFLQADASIVYKCDEDVICKIKALCDGDNSDILEKLVSFEELVLTYVTPLYMKEDVSCCSLKFNKDDSCSVTNERVHIAVKNGGNRDKTLQVIESNGAYCDVDKTLWRYSVYSKNDVVACYTCLTTDDAPCGEPAGFVAAGKDSCEDDVKSALEALKSVGVDCSVPYPDTCP